MFRKDRGMDRPSRPKLTQRNDTPPKLESAKASPARSNQGKPAAGDTETEVPPAKQTRAPWSRPMPGSTPNRLTALLGEPVTRPVNAAPEQTVSEPRRETGKRMHIGQDISISGEITTCDVLVVDGHVDATVRDCGRLEIGPAGTLRGDIEVRNAEIGGHFDGELKVLDRLTVRGTGRVSGVVRYGRLEVTVGGQLRGDIAPADQDEESDVKETVAETPALERPDSPARPSAASILKPNDSTATAPAANAPALAADDGPPVTKLGTAPQAQDDTSRPAVADGPEPKPANATEPTVRTIADTLNRSAAE